MNWIIIMGLLCGCSHPNEGVSTIAGPGVSTFKPDTILAGARDTVILIVNGEGYVKGHINGNSKVQPKYTLHVWRDQVITAILHPAIHNGNLRINKIVKPGDVTDGPFKDTVRYAADANGMLHFIIGENPAEDKPYTGDFILHVTVK